MDWRNELYNWESNPPSDAWKKISNDLDNEFLNVKKRLATYEELPPAPVWDRIVNKLNVGRAIEMPLPSKWNRKRFYRMAVAAAIAALFITGVEYLFFRTGSTKPAEGRNAGVTIKPDTALARPETPNPITANAGGLKNFISKIISPKKNPINSNEKEAAIDIIPTNASESEITPVPESELAVDQIQELTDHYDLNTYSKRVQNHKGEVSDDINMLDLMNGYFILPGGNGDDVRVSSKFKSLKGLFNSNPNTKEILGAIFSGNDYWKSIIAKWQQKLVNSGFIPAAHNFMDIQELMKMLQEESK